MARSKSKSRKVRRAAEQAEKQAESVPAEAVTTTEEVVVKTETSEDSPVELAKFPLTAAVDAGAAKVTCEDTLVKFETLETLEEQFMNTGPVEQGRTGLGKAGGVSSMTEDMDTSSMGTPPVESLDVIRPTSMETCELHAKAVETPLEKPVESSLANIQENSLLAIIGGHLLAETRSPEVVDMEAKVETDAVETPQAKSVDTSVVGPPVVDVEAPAVPAETTALEASLRFSSAEAKKPSPEPALKTAPEEIIETNSAATEVEAPSLVVAEESSPVAVIGNPLVEPADAIPVSAENTVAVATVGVHSDDANADCAVPVVETVSETVVKTEPVEISMEAAGITSATTSGMEVVKLLLAEVEKCPPEETAEKSLEASPTAVTNTSLEKVNAVGPVAVTRAEPRTEGVFLKPALKPKKRVVPSTKNPEVMGAAVDFFDKWDPANPRFEGKNQQTAMMNILHQYAQKKKAEVQAKAAEAVKDGDRQARTIDPDKAQDHRNNATIQAKKIAKDKTHTSRGKELIVQKTCMLAPKQAELPGGQGNAAAAAAKAPDPTDGSTQIETEAYLNRAARRKLVHEARRGKSVNRQRKYADLERELFLGDGILRSQRYRILTTSDQYPTVSDWAASQREPVWRPELNSQSRRWADYSDDDTVSDLESEDNQLTFTDSETESDTETIRGSQFRPRPLPEPPHLVIPGFGKSYWAHSEAEILRSVNQLRKVTRMGIEFNMKWTKACDEGKPSEFYFKGIYPNEEALVRFLGLPSTHSLHACRTRRFSYEYFYQLVGEVVCTSRRFPLGVCGEWVYFTHVKETSSFIWTGNYEPLPDWTFSTERAIIWFE